MNRRHILALASLGLILGGAASRTPEAFGHSVNEEDPLVAAEYLSMLETIEHIPALYELYGFIHPDAAAVVPRGTMIGWYKEDFQPRGPQPAIATGVTWLDEWTWDVTGQTYTDVAEVSFTQEFADVGVIEDVVRLKWHDNAWRWWFGRDADWVEEQKHRFSLIENTPQEGVAPSGLSSLTTLDETILDHLPDIIDDPHFGRRYELALTAGSFNPDGIRQPEQMLLYKPTDGTEFQLGNITYGSVQDSTSDAEDLLRFADYAQNAPPVEFIGWNTEPASGPAWLQTTNAGVDVMGPAYSITLVMNGNYLDITMFSEVALGMVLDVLGNGIS